MGVDVGSATYEFASAEVCEARNCALAYLTAVRRACRNELLTLNQTNEMEGSTHGYSIKIDRYDSSMGPTSSFDSHATVATMRFIANYVERLGYPVMPRNQRLRSEMHALLGWLFCHHPERSGSDVPFKNLAEEHPEWPLFRDTAIVFKFLSSMISEQQEIFMVKRGGGSGGGRGGGGGIGGMGGYGMMRGSAARNFRLAFETEQGNTRMRDFGARLQVCVCGRVCGCVLPTDAGAHGDAWPGFAGCRVFGTWCERECVSPPAPLVHSLTQSVTPSLTPVSARRPLRLPTTPPHPRYVRPSTLVSSPTFQR